MSRTRWFTLLTACFFVASAAWADDLGYVDCASHPESARLFSKARQTPDALGTVACGERFTILVYGFVFSRVQTKDGKVGYLYSNLITPDRGGPSASQAAAGSAPASAANVPTATSAANAAAKIDARPATPPAPEKPAAQAGPLFPTPPMPAVTPSGTASAPGLSSAANIQPPPDASQPAQSAPSPSPSPSGAFPAAQPQPAASPAQPRRAQVAQAVSVAPAATAAPPPSSPAQADLPAEGATGQPALPAPSSPSTPPQESSPAQPGPLFPSPPGPTSVADSAPASAGPEPAPPAAASQPEAAPAPDPVRSARPHSTWERPLPGVHQSFLVEFYSGYALDHVSSGATSSNLSGGMGSAGYNLKPWLQIIADTSYNLVSSGGVKNVLYGNHFGGRYFYHRNRWGMTPFAEGLVGGSRFDISVSGTGGYKTSDNCISYKAGGGIDIRVKKHWEIRVIDVDYYRTSFGGTAQNNYWATAGVVLRLFGSGASE